MAPIFTRLPNNFIPSPETIPQNTLETPAFSASSINPMPMKLIPGFDIEGAS